MVTRHRSRMVTFLYGLRRYTRTQLIFVVRERRYPPLLRIAALRWLIQQAPLEVTHGAPYWARRRYVRQYYHV